jgi:hypothetical protein
MKEFAMRYWTRTKTLLVTVTAIAMSIALAATQSQGVDPAQEPENKQRTAKPGSETSKEDSKNATFRGQVVDLARYLTDERAPDRPAPKATKGKPSEAKQKGKSVPDGPEVDNPFRKPTGRRASTGHKASDGLPIGLSGRDESLLGKLSPGKPLYLVICDPDQPQPKQAYDTLRGMVGQEVKIVGQKVERDGIPAIVIERVERMAAAQVDGQ